jgi:hypothetical protein
MEISPYRSLIPQQISWHFVESLYDNRQMDIPSSLVYCIHEAAILNALKINIANVFSVKFIEYWKVQKLSILVL